MISGALGDRVNDASANHLVIIGSVHGDRTVNRFMGATGPVSPESYEQLSDKLLRTPADDTRSSKKYIS